MEDNFKRRQDKRNLLPLKEYEGIRIVTPAQFIQALG